jgi:ferritin-like metal-binding protein YciE
MTTIASTASLLHAAVQDLHAGKADAATRLLRLAEHATDPELAELLGREAGRAGEQAQRIAGTGADGDGPRPRNLWMTGILDDAERDTRQTQAGRLLDIALIGAVRKAKAAEIVSSETAIALAEALADAPLAAVVRANHGEEIATDRALKAMLERLAGS